MLELTKKADYALRLMIEVAASDKGSITTAGAAEREAIPYPFLRKVAQELVAAGLLASSRGVGGGLSLARPAQTISLLTVVRAVDEPTISRCVVDSHACNRRSHCLIYPVWCRLQRDLERAMDAVLLSDLAAGKHPVVCVEARNTPSRRAKRPANESPLVSSQRVVTKAKFKVTPERSIS